MAIRDASGLFENTPYKINWATFSGADSAIEALQAGATDVNVGLNFSAPILNQANTTEPWTVKDRPYVIIGANKQSNIKTVADMAGHDVDEAVELADRILILTDGRISLDQRIDIPKSRHRSDPLVLAMRSRLLAELGV